MLLTLTTTHTPATDLGYLLAKHPAKLQTFELNFGKAHVFYPEVTETRCTAALLLDVDPIGLVRGRAGSSEGGLLEQYVNDRPYVASSFMSVAIGDVLGTALAGRCKDRPELVQTAIPLEAKLAVLPCRGGEVLLRQLFEPLGYTITVEQHPLDSKFSDWGPSRYFTVTLAGTTTLSTLLTHLYVLIPVLDDEKHYFVGSDEVEKLHRRGEDWLASHPERELITRRYLRYKKRLTQDALTRLTETSDTSEDEVETAEIKAADEQHLEASVVAQPSVEVADPVISLHQQRLNVVLTALKGAQAKRVLDLGCGEGQLLRKLLEDRSFEHILGMDVSIRSLETAHERLRLDQLPPLQRQRIQLIHGSLMYRDRRLENYDAAAIVEVIEHLDPPRLAAFERVAFEFARPSLIVITTPNAEYNVKFETLHAGQFRHKDHRFEWTRAQFQAWGAAIAERFGYAVQFSGIGPHDEAIGAPSQMAIFERDTSKTS